VLGCGQARVSRGACVCVIFKAFEKGERLLSRPTQFQCAAPPPRAVPPATTKLALLSQPALRGKTASSALVWGAEVLFWRASGGVEGGSRAESAADGAPVLVEFCLASGAAHLSGLCRVRSLLAITPP
jgi:hypothetical protein